MVAALSKLNFRDLGGLPSLDGRRVRPGVVYRSEGPGSFLDEHRAALGGLGVRTVCDLRSEVERQVAPNDWCGPACQVLHLDLNTDLRAADATHWDSLRTDPSPENARRVIMRNYRSMPAALNPHLSLIARALLAGEVPMMVYCTAGKDRTGVAIALLLSLLGVSLEQILADYAKSDLFGENLRVIESIHEAFRKSFGFVPSAPVVKLLIGISSEFLLAALETIDRDWGSIAAYFEAGGIELRRQEQLRALLLA